VIKLLDRPGWPPWLTALYLSARPVHPEYPLKTATMAPPRYFNPYGATILWLKALMPW